MKPRLLFLLFLIVPASVVADPVFTNRTGDPGGLPRYTGGWEFFVGGGIASFDCDGDLLPELFVAGGTSTATLLRNRTPARGGMVSFVADTPPALAITGVTGAYPLDFDSDGHLDLFVMRVGDNMLLHGGPECSFSRLQVPGLAGGNRWTTAFSATWEDGNTRPTLAVGNYVDRFDPKGPFGTCDINILLRPVAGGYSETPLRPGYCPLSMLFSDWNRAGRQDLRLSNDRHYYLRDGSEQLWAMEDTPRLYQAKDGWRNFSLWGMGIASRDISGDGLPEVFLSSMGDQKLQLRDLSVDGPAYGNAAYRRGTTAHRPYTGGDGRPSTGWQIEFGDVDNDGLDDVFIAKGNVEQMPDSAMTDPNNLLMQAANGVFSERGLAAGIATTERSRGAALVDLNLDGRLDLVVVNRRAPLEVYQNTTADTGNWLLLEVHQNGPNPQAVGAWVEVTDGAKTWHREITVGGGHAGGSASLMHFGLGKAENLRLRVIWPDSTVSAWQDISANRILQVERLSAKLLIRPR